MLLYETNCPKLDKPHRGKVRDIFTFDKTLLLVATDRISAFDVVSDQAIPEKGRLLTAMTVHWFDWMRGTLPWLENHFITADWAKIVDLQPELAPYEDQLAGRSMLVHKMDSIIPLEVIIRLYLYGSGWGDYQETGAVCGIQLPKGMKKADKLPAPMFAPSTKAEVGHDENISVDEAIRRGLITQAQMVALAGAGITILSQANEYAISKGIVVPDTKFEFGLLDGRIVLADEVLTPDSSRFWPADQYEPGKNQPSFDKQFVREYLETQVKAGRWDKTDPMPALPDEIVVGTTARYLQACKMLTGNN